MSRLLALLVLPSVALAAPIQLGHQGRVLDSVGTPVQGSHTLVVELLDGDGGVVYDEDFGTLTLNDGFYSVILGANDTLQHTVLDEPELYAQVRLDGVAMGQPTLVVSSPYAGRASVAARIDVVDDISSTACSDAGRIVLDSVVGGLRVCDGTSWITLGTKVVSLTPEGRRWSDGSTARSCLEYLEPSGNNQYTGDIGDGDYIIDVDGDGPLDAVTVDCDMSGGGWTVFHHNREVRFVSNGGESPRSLQYPVTYDAPIGVVTAARDAASSVQQAILKECRGSVIVDSDGTTYTGWVYPPAQLAPGSAWPGHSTCDLNDDVQRQAGGTLTNASLLPVIRIDNGDTGDANETSAFTLGPFRVR